MCCTHPFSGSLDLLPVSVQVGQDLLTHLLCKRNAVMRGTSGKKDLGPKVEKALKLQ